MPIVSSCIWSDLSTVYWFVYRPRQQYSLYLAVDRLPNRSHLRSACATCPPPKSPSRRQSRQAGARRATSWLRRPRRHCEASSRRAWQRARASRRFTSFETLCRSARRSSSRTSTTRFTPSTPRSLSPTTSSPSEAGFVCVCVCVHPLPPRLHY